MTASSPPSLCLVLCVIVGVAIVQLPISFFLAPISLSLGIFLLEVFVAGIPLWAIIHYRLERRRLLPLRRPSVKLVVIVVIFTIGMDIVIDNLTWASELFFPLSEHDRLRLDTLMAIGSSFEFAKKFFLLCILPGVCEEIFFRGFCQSSLATMVGDRKAIVFVGALFALFHGVWAYFHLYFLLGVSLSWIYAQTKNLWLPITCHIANNIWTLTHHTLDTALPFDDFTSLRDPLILIVGAITAIVTASRIRLFSRPLSK